MDVSRQRWRGHNLLDDDELTWLGELGKDGLTDAQKHGLVVARRTGKVTNAVLRDLCGLDSLSASRELRALRDKGLLVMKGKAAATFYVLEQSLLEKEPVERAPAVRETGGEKRYGDEQKRYGNEQKSYGNEQKRYGNDEKGYGNVPASIAQDLAKLGKKAAIDETRRLIAELCRLAPRTRRELAELLRRDPKYLTEKHLRPMVEAGTLTLARPNEPRHPDQAYIAVVDENGESRGP